VDGATIHPNINQQGGYHDDAYVQVVDGQVTARFGVEDLIYTMDNPQTDVRYAGYGYSPLEHLIVSITAELYAAKYNSSYFEKGAVPEGMINLGPEVAPEDVDAFRLYWANEIMGRPWALPIMGGSTAEWIPWRASNKDMEYMAYQEWLLKKMCAMFQIDPKEVGLIQDVNRSTAESQDSAEETKGIQPLLALIEDTFEVEVIGEHGLGLGDWIKFQFDEESESEDAINARYGLMVPMGAASRQEWRQELNMPPGEDPGLDLYLTEGEPKPLPSSPEDLEALSPAMQAAADREAFEHEKDQFGHQQDMDRKGLKIEEQKAKQPPRPAARPGGKVAKVFDDPNPEMVESQEDMDAVFDRAQRKLFGELGDILGVSLGDERVRQPA
jgi:hypothetical protein